MKINAKDIFKATGVKVKVLRRTTSTFKDSEEFPDGVIVALEQTSGRGRLDRSFTSPKGGLYINFNLPYVSDPTATLKIGLAVFNVIDALGIKASVKWPNDVYAEIGGKVGKVCGILCKKSDDRLLIGIGINYATNPDLLTGKALSLCLNEDDATSFMIALINSVMAELKKQLDKAYYESHCLTIGKRVRFGINEESGLDEVGTAIGIDENTGELSVNSNGEIKRISSGDVAVYE